MAHVTPGVKKAKLRFFALYLFGLLLVFVVVSSFWQKKGVENQQTGAASERESYFVQVDTMLHSKLEQLDEMYSAYVKDLRSGGDGATTTFLSAKNNFALSLDSIDQQASFLSDGVKKEAMNTVAAKFRKTFEARYNLISELAGLPKQLIDSNISASAETAAMSQEMEELKKILVDKEQKIVELESKVQTNATANKTNPGTESQRLNEILEKDKIIASLQTQIKQKDAALQKAATVTTSKPVVTNNAADGEWKQKYSSLKAAYDKASANEKSLKNAYKTVADDNRRLLGQLQSMRKG